MQTLIDLFATFEALGDKTAFVNRTGVRRLVVSYGEFSRSVAEDGKPPGAKRRGAGRPGAHLGPELFLVGRRLLGHHHPRRHRRAGGLHVRPGAGGIHPPASRSESCPAEPLQAGADDRSHVAAPGRPPVPAGRGRSRSAKRRIPRPGIWRSSSILPALPAIRKGSSLPTKTWSPT